MNRSAYLRLIRGQTRGAPAAAARAALRAASWGFRAAAVLRGRLYDAGLLRARHPGLPVVSVGNLTAGGTGKTPLVAWLARLLQEAGRRPAVLTRGYRAPPGQASDEAAELLRALPGLVVVQDPDRLAGAAEARRRGADVLLLDDGFQHRRIARDLELVVVSALDPDGGGALLPRGLLREPLSALRRADFVLLTHVDLASEEQLARARQLVGRAAPGLPLLEARHVPARVALDGREEPPAWLAGRRLFAFCGLGGPDGFFRTLEQSGAQFAGQRAFDDHHPFSEEELLALDREAAAGGAEALVTSRKDAMRIPCWPGALPLAVLEIELGLAPPDEALLRERVLEVVARADGIRS